MRNLKDVVSTLLHQSALQSLSDEGLLRAFAAARDESAFAELVRRYAPLVSGVCQNVLRDRHRAEDAFQAAFLVLARKAADLAGRRLALGGWLYKVARRVAVRARLNALREQARAARAEAARRADTDAQAEVTWREVQRVLDEELDRLPDKLRVPFLLCFVEGRTQDEAAERLGMPRGTFRLRLDAARALLQKRLSARGITLSVLTVLALKADPLSAAVLGEAARAAAGFAAGDGAGARPGAVALAAWALKPAVSVGAAGAVAAVLLAAGGALAYALLPAPAAPPAPPQPPATERAAVEPAPVPRPADPTRPARIPLRGGVVGPDGDPVPGATVAVLADHFVRRGRFERHDRALLGGAADAAGRFHLDVPADFPTWSPEARPVKVFATAPGAPPVGLEIGDFWDGLPPQRVRLPASAEVRGRVTAGGRPVPGAAVRVVRVGAVIRDDVDDPADALPGWPSPVRTDDRGAFVLPNLDAAGGVTLAVRADGFCPQYANAPAGGAAVEVKVFPARPYRGRVVAADTGAPLAGCEVALRSASPVTPMLTARTGADGRFEVPAGADRRFVYRLFPPADGPYPAVAGPAPAVGDEEAEFRVPRGAAVGGVVRDQATGAPVAGARVVLALTAKAPAAQVPIQGTDSMVVTDRDGRFRLPVPVGRTDLVVYAPDNEYVSRPFDWRGGEDADFAHEVCVHAAVPLDLAPGAAARELTVGLRRGVPARGEVLGPDGQPVARAMLVCRSLTAAVVPVRDGRFVLPGRAPGVDYPVAVLDGGGRAGAVATVRAGAPAVIRLQPCATAVARFVDTDGRPVRGHTTRVAMCLPLEGRADADPPAARPVASILPTAVFDARQQAAPARTGADGRAELPGLIPGAVYELYHRADGAATSDARFVPKPGERLALPDIVLRRP